MGFMGTLALLGLVVLFVLVGWVSLKSGNKKR
jgi:hypothetical protein